MIRILTLNWNGKDKLEKLYPSLLKVIGDLPHQWLIKDNNSVDGSKELIKSWENSNVKLIECEHNLDSFSKGCNVLYAESKADSEDYVLLLNNDVIFNDVYSLKNMISIMEKDPLVGVVGAKLKYTNTNKLQHAGVVFGDHGLPLHFRANQKDDQDASMNREFQAVTGAVWLTKAKYYEKVCTDNKSGLNGFPEQLWWSFDDIYACLAIKYEQNKKIVYCGKTDIFHEESASLKKNPTNKLFMNHNINYLKNKWKGKYINDESIYTKNIKNKLYEVK